MFKEFQKVSLKYVLPRVIAALAAAVILLAVTGFGAFTLLFGAVGLSELSPDEYEGRFVTIDSSRVVYAYATTSDGNDNVVQYSFIIRSDDGRYLSADVRPADFEEFDAAGEAFFEYFQGNTDTVPSLGSFTGQVKALDGDLADMLVSWIADAELITLDDGEDGMEYIIPCDIKINRINGFSYPMIWIFSGVALLCAAYAVFELVRVFNGHYQKHARLAMSDENIDALEAEYAAADLVDQVRVGSGHLWYQHGAYTHAARTQDIVWIFSHVDPALSGKRRYLMSIYMTDGTGFAVRMLTDAQRKELEDAVRAQGVRFVSGYSYKLAQTYEKNMRSFMKLAGRDPSSL